MSVLTGPRQPPSSGDAPRQLVVLLHGYGADGNDLIGLADSFGDVLPDALFVSPHAPQRCAGNPFGYQWFPLDIDDLPGSVASGMPATGELISRYLVELWAETGLDARATFLVGFSQGAMVSLYAGLALHQQLLGIVAFSGALFAPPGFAAGFAVKQPVCLVHGELDTVVDPAHSATAFATLREQGYNVRHHASPGLPHGISMDGLKFAAAFMRERIGAATA